MIIKNSSVSMPSHEGKSWMKFPTMLVAAAMLVSAPMSIWAAVYEDDEDEDEADYSEVALVTQRINDFSNSIDFGLRYITDNAFKFGEYNSQDQKGWQVDGNFDLEQRDFTDGSAKYLRAEGNNIGTKSRDLAVEAGQQGDHKFRITFDGIEKHSHGSFINNYEPVAGDPYNLQAAGNPSNDGVSVYREKLGLMFKKQFANKWSFTADASQESKTGTRDYAYAFNKLYPYPIDYTTSNVNLTAEYAAKNYQFQLGYELSTFDNAGDAVIGALGGTDQAQEPENLLQTLFWNGNYRITDATRANAYISYAIGEQDEGLIESDSVNHTRTTADAKVKNIIARVGVSSRLTDKINVSAKYNYRDNDNQTAVFTNNTDNFSTPIFDTTWESLTLNGSYRLPKASKLGLGYKHEKIKRPGQDREKTNEDKLWASYKLPMMGRFSGTLKLSVADRDGSDYDVNTISNFRKNITTDNAKEGTQRPNFADRKQKKAQFRGQYQLGNTGYVGLMLQSWNDDYNKAMLGLQDLKGELYTVDFGASPMRELSYSLYAGMQRYRYDQKGNDGADDWFTETDDKGVFAGLNIEWELIPNLVAATFDYRYTENEAKFIQEHDNNSVNPLSDLEHQVHRVELAGEYFYSKQATLVARVVYEDYESSNWAYLDDSGSINTVGYEDPYHNAGLIEFGMRYQF